MPISIQGRVIERDSRRGWPQLLVEAWDERSAGGPSGSGRTGRDGSFEIVVADQDPDGNASFYFRIYQDAKLLASTEREVVWRPVDRDPDHPLVLEASAPHRLRVVQGRLLDHNGSPLPDRLLRLWQAGPDGPVELGGTLSDHQGEFAAVIEEDLTLLVDVLALDGTPLAHVDGVRARPDGTLELRTGLAGDDPPDPPLAELAETLGLRLPDGYLASLAERGIRTFGELGRASDDLLDDGSDDAIRRLLGHAALRTLELDPQRADALLDGGFRSVAAIASTPEAEFVGRLRDRLGHADASAVHTGARAQASFMDNLVAAERVNLASGVAPNGRLISLPQAVDAPCSCDGCRSAVSPAAYLADLYRYTVDHVRDGANPVDLRWLTDLTLQPLRSLPLSCEAGERTVRRLRIVVEVLRRHLARSWTGVPQERRDALAKAERAYRQAAYLGLLAEHGTSFQELRAARLAKDGKRAALAARLGVDLGTSRPDPLDALFLDPDASPPALTEPALETLFGLKDTAGDPLAAAPAGRLHDLRVDHLHRAWADEDLPADAYSFEQELPVLPVLDPDLVGPSDLRDQRFATSPTYAVWKTRRDWVDDTLRKLEADHQASGLDAILEKVLGSPLPDLDQLLADLGGSDADAARQAVADLHLTVDSLTRLIEVRAKDRDPDPAKRPTADEYGELYAILAQALKVAEFPAWIQEESVRRLRLDFDHFRLVPSGSVPSGPWLGAADARKGWQDALRRRAAPPLVDPDLIGPADLADPVPGDPAYDLWKARRQWVDGHLAQYQALPPTLANLDTTATTALDHLPQQRWEGLVRHQLAGTDLAAQLRPYTIEPGELGTLARLRSVLEAGQPVLEAEWAEAASVLAQVLKRRAFPTWRSEERARRLLLGPPAFRLRERPAPPPARGSVQAQRDWQDRLRSRVDQQAALAEAAGRAIAAAEEAALPLLRDALVEAIVGDTAAAAQLSDRLLLDVRAGSCELTTRIEQAVETLQVLLFSLRTGQLADTYPDLRLHAEHFDEEWRWIGSYATWRAAMLVFLFPENLMLPVLRHHQTAGFSALVAELRGNRRLSPERAGEAARAYLAYFDDIRSLRVAANVVTGTRVSTTRRIEHTYLFAQSEPTGRVYWSRHDGADPTGHAQTSWAPVSSLAGVEVHGVVGAFAQPGGGAERSIYLFVRCVKDGKEQLAFTRCNLERTASYQELVTAGWDDLQTLELPSGTVAFRAVLVQDQVAEVPQLAIHTADRKVYLRRVRGTDWEEGTWQALHLRYQAQPPDPSLPQDSPAEVLAVVAVTGWGYFIFARYDQGDVYLLFYAYFQGLRTIRQLPPVQRWQGAFALDDQTQAENPSWPKARTLRVYAFWHDGIVSRYQSFGIGGTFDLFSIAQSTNSFVGDADGYLAVAGGDTAPQGSDGARVAIAYHRGGPWTAQGAAEPGLFLALVGRFGTDSTLFESQRRPIAPRFTGANMLQLAEGLADQQRRHDVFDTWLPSLRYWWSRSANLVASNRDYLEEAYFVVPLHLALQLQQRRDFVAALDWFRVVYDYSGSPHGPTGGDERKIYIGLVEEESLPFGFRRPDDWLLDTMNPHAVAATRRLTATRFTLLALVRCLLEFGDDQLTADTAETVARARVLYGTALDLLDLPELAQQLDGCDALIGQLDVTIGGPEWVSVLSDLRAKLHGVGSRAVVQETVAAVNAALHSSDVWEERMAAARSLVDAAVTTAAPAPAGPVVLEAEARLTEACHRAALRVPTVEQVARRIGGVAARDRLDLMATDDGVRGALRLAGLVDGGTSIGFGGYFTAAPSFSFCVPPNPLPSALRLWGELNLFKIRSCRNIAGLDRDLEPYAAPTDSGSGLPAIGRGGQLVVPGAKSYRPTPYRFPLLIQRAKELAELARQTEQSMLGAIQQGEVDRYNRLKAGHDLALSRAGIRLQDLRVHEAEGGVRLAELARQRAALQVDHYNGLLEEGPSATEQAAAGFLWAAAGLHTFSALWSGAAALAHGTAAGLASSTANPVAAASEAAGVASSMAGAASSAAQAASTISSILSTIASWERRAEEWEFQRALAQQEVAIGDQQYRLAEDRVQVMAQERQIAQLHADQAEETITFLDNKFGNAELYDFMVDVLERVYGFFLQQATSVAQLASAQLAFERQEDPPPVIRADYWLAPAEDAPDGAAAADRRGLTGSARLLEDITQLDQYAFETDRRKLQLTATISLARLAPLEFARFRQTGEIHFETPSALFDREFPGHYLRLVRRVRTSVIALIPPNTGIRATLAQSGPSYAVIGGPTFSRVKVQRQGFDEVALSSPYSATGLFELDIQPEMRLPFEGIGLDTRWTFRMPKAANPFDYRSLADVILLIEYTALSDVNYRTQVIEGLDPVIEATLPISLRHRFPDQWYQLHNPGSRTTPFSVELDLHRYDLPPNLSDFHIQHVALLLATADGEPLTTPVTIDKLGLGVVAFPAVTSTEGLASSRTNAPSWLGLPKNPVGRWTLQFADDQITRDLFGRGRLDDILLVITFTGRGPEWI
jgi:hypothetical protein